MHHRMIKKKIFYGQNAQQARFFYETEWAAGKTYQKKMHQRTIFLIESWWVICPIPPDPISYVCSFTGK